MSEKETVSIRIDEPDKKLLTQLAFLEDGSLGEIVSKAVHTYGLARLNRMIERNQDVADSERFLALFAAWATAQFGLEPEEHVRYSPEARRIEFRTVEDEWLELEQVDG